MDAILFGAGFKRVLIGMALYGALVVTGVQFVGYLKGTVSPDQMALVGALFGAVSIGGIATLLVRELRGPTSLTERNDQ